MAGSDLKLKFDAIYYHVSDIEKGIASGCAGISTEVPGLRSPI